MKWPKNLLYILTINESKFLSVSVASTPWNPSDKILFKKIKKLKKII